MGNVWELRDMDLPDSVQRIFCTVTNGNQWRIHNHLIDNPRNHIQFFCTNRYTKDPIEDRQYFLENHQFEKKYTASYCANWCEGYGSEKVKFQWTKEDITKNLSQSVKKCFERMQLLRRDSPLFLDCEINY